MNPGFNAPRRRTAATPRFSCRPDAAVFGEAQSCGRLVEIPIDTVMLVATVQRRRPARPRLGCGGPETPSRAPTLRGSNHEEIERLATRPIRLDWNDLAARLAGSLWSAHCSLQTHLAGQG